MGKCISGKRASKDIWEDLYEFVLWETDQPYAEEILRSDFARRLFGAHSLTVRYISRIYRQELSHQTIQGQFIISIRGKTLTRLERLPARR